MKLLALHYKPELISCFFLLKKDYHKNKRESEGMPNNKVIMADFSLLNNFVSVPTTTSKLSIICLLLLVKDGKLRHNHTIKKMG